MRVPPSQSKTAFAASSSASSGRRRSSAFVMRVRRVPKQNTSTARGRPARRVRELQQVPRVVRHRAGHVEDQDQRPQSHPAPAPERARPARRASASSRAPSDAGPAGGPSASRPCGGCERRGGINRMPRHDAADRSELLGRARRERLVAPELDIRRHQAELGRVGRRPPRCRARSRGSPAPRSPAATGLIADRHGSGSCVALVEEEPPEHAVVHGDLIAPDDQRRAPRPVEVDEIGRIERGRARTRR